MESFIGGTVVDNSKSELLQKDRVVVETPCKHRFHERCLKTWMTTKMDCPNCRKPLPVLSDDDDEPIEDDDNSHTS